MLAPHFSIVSFVFWADATYEFSESCTHLITLWMHAGRDLNLTLWEMAKVFFFVLRHKKFKSSVLYGMKLHKEEGKNSTRYHDIVYTLHVS